VLDLSKLNDDELELLERLLSKAAGQFDGEVVRIEFVNGNTAAEAALPMDHDR
jgi:hypothetical protein